MMLHLRECLWPVTGHETEDSGAEISGGVDGVAAVEAEGDADGQDHQANQERLDEAGNSSVLVVCQSPDAKQ